MRSAALTVLVMCVGSVGFVGGAAARAADPISVTPSTSPVAVARMLSAPGVSAPRSIVLSGFADDIGTLDFLPMPQASLVSTARVQQVRSPWLDLGSRRVQSRLSLWLAALRALGVSIDEFVIVPPTEASQAKFAAETASGISRISLDPRYAGLLKQYPQLAATGGAPGTKGPTPWPEWNAAMKAQMSAAAASSQSSAIRARFPRASVRSLVAPSTLPSTVTASSGSPAAASGARPASDHASPAPAPPVDPRIATLSSSTLSKAQAALSAVPDRLAPWTGGLAYAATDWKKVLGTQASPALRSYVAGMDPAGQRIVAESIRLFVRPMKAEDVDPSMLDRRAATAGANSQQFALAMSDCAQAHKLLTDGVALSLLAVQQGNQAYLDRCIAILRCVAEWAPFQRRGWTAYRPDIVVPRGGDGVWLATGWGICGVVDMLSILGDRVPADLQAALQFRLRSEVNQIVTDWADARPWYVQSRAVQCNQWIIPSTGLVKACLYLRDPRLLPAYNLGVENVAASIRSLGKDGEFLEGVSYAAMTLEPVFDLLADLKANGDLRCHAMGFVNNSWRWFAQMLMPGANLVNCDDSGMSALPDWARETPLPAMVAATLASSDPDAVPSMRTLFRRGNTSIHGIKYQAALDAAASAPDVSLANGAFFPAQQLLVWRSAWEMPSLPQSALGMWFKGGTTREGHCHRDQGQLSIYSGSRAILTESGTPDYSTADMDTKYASAAGHGIMQIGEVAPRGTPVDAPMTVSWMDASGGSATVDSTKAYTSALSCTRSVTWSSSGRFDIADSVRFAAAVPAGSEVYRFHTGSSAPLSISSRNGQWSISWDDAVISISADCPIEVSQVAWPDALTPNRMHQAVSIRVGSAVTGMALTTSVAVTPVGTKVAAR